ncbi:T9SS type A sorting domain-containing protein [Polaribacter sp.]|uniref:T9SS type A sorting domain-containing protein n=1 Tax=Polaribacter sp. TaxID=1920175 RepID=UPI004048C9BC
MKKQLLFIALLVTSFINAQSIEFTSDISTAEIGKTIKVDFKYTVAADGYIFCGINLLNDWTWVSYVGGGDLSPAPAGTDVAGSITFTIPEGTTPSSSLTGQLNYKINIELKTSTFDWLAGAYPATPINLTAASLSTNNFEKDLISVFPNPANDLLQLRGIENTKISQVTISNVLGKKVLATSNLKNNSIDISNLNAGIYILSISSENSQKRMKFIKN